MKAPLKIISMVCVALLCLSSSGCIFLLIGGGAVGGYAATRDTFEGVSSKGQEELVAAAHKVLSIMGTIIDERPKDGEIVGTVNGAHVVIDIIQINLTTSKIRVKARKDLLPNLSIAQDVYTKIVNQLE